MSMTRFNMTRDVNGYNGFGLPFSIDKYSVNLPTSPTLQFTIPSKFTNGCLVVFSFTPGASVWVAVNDIAAVPSSLFVATTSELNPVARQVNGGDVLSFTTSDDGTTVGIALYAL